MIDAFMGAVWTLIVILVAFVMACVYLAIHMGPDDGDPEPDPAPDPWLEFDYYLFESNLLPPEDHAFIAQLFDQEEEP